MTSVDYSNRRNTAEYQELLNILRDNAPGGALILGGVGMGKTSLADAVLSAPDIPEPVMRLYCSPSLHNVPYGVLSPYLGALESLDKPVEVLREINSVLAEHEAKPGTSNIVVVEDAQYLDEQSCFVFSLLMENAALKIIAVGTGAIETNSPLEILSASSLMPTIVVKPLDLEGVRAVAEAIISGTLSESSVRTARIMSGGNPSFVEAYVATCIEQEILLKDEFLLSATGERLSIWTTSKIMPELDDRLTDLVLGLHRLSTEAEQRTLELLALGGSQTRKLLEHGGFTYQRMLEAGELQVVDGDFIALHALLYQEVLRLLVPAQRSAELYATFHHWCTELGQERTSRQILWGLEIGDLIGQEEVFQAAQQAVDNLDYDLAGKLCQSGHIARQGTVNALFEVQVLMGLGHFYSARSLLLHMIEDLEDPELLGEAFSKLLIVLTNLGTDIAHMQSFVELWEERAQQVRVEHYKVRALAMQHTGQQILRLWSGINTTGGQRPGTEELEEILESPALSLDVQVIVLLMLCDVHSIAGRNLKAIEVSERIAKIVGNDRRIQALYEAKLVFRMGWNLIFSGQDESAKEYLARFRVSPLPVLVGRQGALTLLDGLSDLLQGRLQRALCRFAEAVTELRMNDPAQILSLAMNLYRFALKQSGVLGRAQPSAVGSSAHKQAFVDATEYPGESGSEQRIFARAVAAALGEALGSETLESFPLIERLALACITSQMSDEQLPQSPESQRLGELAYTHEGSRAALLAQLGVLRGSTEGKPLEELAQLALRRGDYLVGVEALARAAVRYANAGEPRTCGGLLRQAARIIEEQGVYPNQYISRALALTELTAREAEIVQLVLSGKNNAQIARTLVVSQRTVEGHLYRVFSKLGISERSELRNANLDLGTSQYE